MPCMIPSERVKSACGFLALDLGALAFGACAWRPPGVSLFKLNLRTFVYRDGYMDLYRNNNRNKILYIYIYMYKVYLRIYPRYLGFSRNSGSIPEM